MSSSKETKPCHYGENCYRKNPVHFKEFSHQHLEKIYKRGRDPYTNDYVIPDEMFISAEIISQQLRIFETIFPKENAPKRQHVLTTQFGSYKQTDSNGAQFSSASNDTKVKNSLLDASTSSRQAPLLGTTSEERSSINKVARIEKNIKDYNAVVMPKGRMAEKLKNSAPYNFFLTAIYDSSTTHKEPLTVTFQEILDKSMGEIESSVQINFMVDIGWLLGQYYFAGVIHTPLLVLYGDETLELRDISRHHPQVTSTKIKMPTPFATSHAKIMLLAYKDGSMRVIISTANLYEADWHNRTQGVWISPRLGVLPSEADTTAGESQTGFRQDLMLYLVEYKIPKLQPWIARIRKSDFSSVNVFFVGSVPGGFREGPRGYPWGHARLGHLLNNYTTTIDEKTAIVCQSSSIGSLGPNIQTWIQHDIINSLRRDSTPLGVRRIPPFSMIYPSFENVINSHDGIMGGECLPYSKTTNDKQPWLKAYLHQWKADSRFRSQAMPHIKSYTRFNLVEGCLFWFVLTSANLSKAAWGSFNKKSHIQPCLRIANFEAGVLYVPRFVIGKETFSLGAAKDGIPPFPLPYDVPLNPYGPDDVPFHMDYRL